MLRRASQFLAAGGIGLALTLSGASAWAATDTPDDVQQYVDGPALAQVVAMSAGGTTVDGKSAALAPAAATELGKPRAVYAFTEEFSRGDASAAPVKENGTWVAPVLSGSTPIGTALIWRDGGELAVAEVTDDAALGVALASGPGGQIVYDAPAAAWFSLDGDRLVVLTAPGADAKEYSLSAYATILGKYQAGADSQRYDVNDPMAGGGGYLVASTRGLPWWAFVAFGVAAVAAVAIVVIVRVNASKDATTSRA